MEEPNPPENRSINTGGGDYNERIEGDYIQGNVTKIYQTINNLDDIPNSLVKRDLFLVGCTVGQRLAIIPFPGFSTSDILDDFLQAITRLNLRNDTSIEKIVDARKTLASAEMSIDNDLIKLGINNFLDGITEFANVLRENQSVEAFNYFLLGKLLFEIATFSVIDKDIFLKTHQVGTLRVLVNMMQLPTIIQQHFIEFCDSIDIEEADTLISSAQKIATIVHNLI